MTIYGHQGGQIFFLFLFFSFLFLLTTHPLPLTFDSTFKFRAYSIYYHRQWRTRRRRLLLLLLPLLLALRFPPKREKRRGLPVQYFFFSFVYLSVWMPSIDVIRFKCLFFTSTSLLQCTNSTTHAQYEFAYGKSVVCTIMEREEKRERDRGGLMQLRWTKFTSS